MNSRAPVQSVRQALPFHDSAFGWDTFEDFFCDFLNAQPVIVVNDGGTEIRRKVIRAQPFGRKGDSQLGIDLIAEMEGGEVWDFQCKHMKEWGPEKTRKAIAAYQRNSPRRFLLVTCEASVQCHQIAAENPGWVLWDAREINRRFRDSIEVARAAQILFTHLGPGWAETFLGIQGDGPLIGAVAKFERHLRTDTRFHHRHALIGRSELVGQLDEFVRDEKARVFILTGRGGLGKSRLLLQWSREFNARHPGHTLRFLSDKCADFGPSLQVAPQPLTLVFDDAHRLDDVRRALFHELPRREHIKIVLSLRPGPIGQVMQELIGAGFDTTEIITGEPMKTLTPEQTMELVDAALRPEFSKYRHFLRSASRDCPLIAVVGAELINSGALTGGDLTDKSELRSRVFESLLNDAHTVREKFGAQPTDDFLRLLALLGPVKLDAAFFEKAAPFLALQRADLVSHLRDALDDVGLLHTTGAGTRVTPDLLSDHLAYAACYDRVGQSRTFAERLLEHFSPGEFPKLMQHLAEAEWRATDEKPDAASVVEPLWKWFRSRFESSPFYERSKQIQEWANIAHLQPRRSLELAELAVSLTTAPPSDLGGLGVGSWSTHEYSLDSLPKLLGGVAEHHPEYVARCFDLLWQLGRDKPAGQFNNDQSHPIAVIGDVVTYKHWKTLEILNVALDWMERLLSGDEWRQHLHKPGWLLGKFFEAMFATSVQENWTTGRTFHMRSHPLHLENTSPLRTRILMMCRKLLAGRDARLASQLIPVLEKGCDIARIGFSGSPSREFIEAWDKERLKSLAVMEEMVRDFTEPLIHFQIRRALMHFLRYGKDSPTFRDSCRKVIAGIPDTLDFRIARTAFSSDIAEFERDTTNLDWHKVSKVRWETFVSEVADATHEEYSTPSAWLSHLTKLDLRWRAFDGFRPNFRHLLGILAERLPSEGTAAAEMLLAVPPHPLAHAFDVIAVNATKRDAAKRLRLIRTAADTPVEIVQTAAIACCSWWRHEGGLPEEGWQILEALAPSAPPHIATAIANFVWWGNQQATMRDWHLVTALPFSNSNSVLAGLIASRAAELVSHARLRPDAELVARLLGRYETLDECDNDDLKKAFGKLAEAFPLEMFRMLWRRNQARKSGNESLKDLPFDLARIPFPQIMSAPEVQSIVADCERRLGQGEKLDFDEQRLLRSAIQHGSDNPSAWLEAAANRATNEDVLNALHELGKVGGWDNAALAHPSFARSLLTRARAIGADCHERIFRHLLHVGGARGSTNNEPDPAWRALLESIERLAHQHAADPELGPLFTAIGKHERSWMESNRLRSMAEDELE